jgi:hypothetical protein
MSERYESKIEGLLKKLPPNYSVGTLYVNGTRANVDKFSNLNDGLAFFINNECQVCVFDADKINGICFKPAGEAAAEEEEEEEEEA